MTFALVFLGIAFVAMAGAAILAEVFMAIEDLFR